MASAKTATVLLSGGIDSAACAHLLREQNFEVEGLFIDFGQPAARREHDSAAQVSKWLGIPLRSVNVAGDRTFEAGEIVGRNAFLCFCALLFTGGRSSLLAMGLHAGTTYFDCSPSFVSALGKLVAEHTDGRVVVVAPFVSWTKRDVVEYFRKSGLPIHLTHSCEAGDIPCGECASCRDRKSLAC
jgi:7-cyano-7-deazaguanine synthase